MRKITSLSRIRYGSLLLLATALCHAQDLISDPSVQHQLSSMATHIVVMARSTPPDPHPETSSNGQVAELVALAFVANHYPSLAHRSFMAEVATSQTKKQIGSPASSSGSSSLVQKPLVPQLLGVAVENGAVLDDVTETALTLTTSPYSIFSLVEGDTADTYEEFGAWSRMGMTASFRLADQSNPLASATRKQLSNWGVSIRFTPDVSGRSAREGQIFLGILQPSQQVSINAVSKLEKILANDTDLTTARTNFIKDVSNGVLVKKLDIVAVDTTQDAAVAMVLKVLTDEFTKDLQVPIMKTNIKADSEAAEYISATSKYITSVLQFQDAVTALTNRSVGSIIYNYQQPTDSTAYSEFGVAYAATPKGIGGDVTFNAMTSLYTKPDATLNQHTYRGLAISGELLMKFKHRPSYLASTDDESRVTLTFAGRYQHLKENEHIYGKKADIGIGNVKLEIPIAVGLSLPISATYANAGQTISESYVRGNFGLSMDLDKLKALLSH